MDTAELSGLIDRIGDCSVVLIGEEFAGDVYPVNPKAAKIQRQTAYARISDRPEVPDLVIVAVPAKVVQEVVDQAGHQGIAAVCVISAGFAEAGDEGKRRAQELQQTVRQHGMRMIGPNYGHRTSGTWSHGEATRR